MEQGVAAGAKDLAFVGDRFLHRAALALAPPLGPGTAAGSSGGAKGEVAALRCGVGVGGQGGGWRVFPGEVCAGSYPGSAGWP